MILNGSLRPSDIDIDDRTQHGKILGLSNFCGILNCGMMFLVFVHLFVGIIGYLK